MASQKKKKSLSVDEKTYALLCREKGEKQICHSQTIGNICKYMYFVNIDEKGQNFGW